MENINDVKNAVTNILLKKGREKGILGLYRLIILKNAAEVK